jgi:hypothetical protein
MRHGSLSFLCLFAFLPVLWGQNYLTKVDATGRTYKSSTPNSKIRKNFSLDYYGFSKSKSSFGGKAVSTLYMTFNPLRVTSNFTVSFRSKELYTDEKLLWIQDPKTGKRYYPLHLLPGAEELVELSEWSCIGMVTPMFFLYNRGGPVPFYVDFEPLPPSVESFDVYYDGYLFFEGVKTMGKKNYVGGNTEVSKDFYAFPSVSLVSYELGRSVLLREAGRPGPFVHRSMPDQTCRQSSRTITIAFPKNYNNSTLEIEAYRSEEEFKRLILAPSILSPPCINISN